MEFRSVALLFALFALMTGRGFAQVSPSGPSDRTGEVRGTVEMPGVGGLAGVTVTLAFAASSAEGDAPMAETRTDAGGAFAFTGVEPGHWVVSSRSDDGLAQARMVVVVRPGAVVRAVLRLEVRLSEAVTVTDARGARLKRETPASVGVVSREVIAETRPSHPSEVMGAVPGVWVNVTGGEGHQTAIRQPLTTSPVYLFLEDGVPTRSTGFFNHNALYEINLPAADAIEVTRGPGSALYGSDAIAGVVNVITRSSLERSGLDATLEAGDFGFRRLLTGGNWSRGVDGLRYTLNLTESEGWRAATAYDRQSGTVRWDRARPGSLMKVLASLNRIEQQTAGSSALPEIDYLSEPRGNLTPVSFRSVRAYRASLDYGRTGARTSWSVVPYFRYDSMELLPNWTLTFDPTVYTTDNASVGLLAKWQRDLTPMRTTLLAGVDVDVSPGARVEDIVRPQTSASGLPSGRPVFSSYTTGARIYEYDVTFASVSPYVQADFSPRPRMRVSLGVRVDRMRYDYDDLLTSPDTPRHRRPADALRGFSHVSPKLGWTFQVSDRANLFASYRHAFRAPSEGQLFRQGSAQNTIDLDAVRADNLEVGVRLAPRPRLSLDVSVYQLDKRDDILSFRDPVDGSTQSVNAGHTRHRGVEAALDYGFGARAGVRVAYTYARHTYEDWVVDPGAGLEFSGLDQEAAPRHFGTAMAFVQPMPRVRTGIELMYLGPYWMDAANTTRYGGHALVNLRAQVETARHVRLFARLLNAGDRRYAESASYTLQRGRELAPGRPRTVFAGVEIDWRR
jgi:outer membrane receptor protein involved in Fe transport